MDPLLSPPTRCLPRWHERFAELVHPPSVVRSGCAIDAHGNVPCAPEQLRAHAEAALRSRNAWPRTRALPRTTYTLARYIASEIGAGSPAERVAVGQAAINRSRLERLRDVEALLLFRQSVGHPNRGFYGPIHGPGGVQTAPYGRWASTAADPSIADLVIADFLMQEGDSGWTRGADDQVGMQHFLDPAGKVQREAANHDYWVGPLPGVDHWRTFLFVHRPDIDPRSEVGDQLIARALTAISDRHRPDWSGVPICRRRGWLYAAAAATGSVGLAAVLSAASRSGRGATVAAPSVPSLSPQEAHRRRLASGGDDSRRASRRSGA